jgi:aspartate aminotransferase
MAGERAHSNPAKSYSFIGPGGSRSDTSADPSDRAADEARRVELRQRVLLAQIATGFSFPNADLQYAIEDLERLSIDIGAMERRRDRMIAILDEVGYEHTTPEGTFYIMARAPIPDDMAFSEILAVEGAVVLSGAVVEVPSWFRISLTASDEMVDSSAGAFRRALERAGSVAGRRQPTGASAG